MSTASILADLTQKYDQAARECSRTFVLLSGQSCRQQDGQPRDDEALRLRWRDVHLEGKAPYIEVRGTKSEAAKRPVPLAPAAVVALKAWRKAMVRDLRGDRVFTTPQRADWQDWRDLTDDLGLPHYRPHDLRHGFATYLLEEGVDIKVVQVLIGHASPDFTRKVYQHVRPELHRQAARAMQRRLKGS